MSQDAATAEPKRLGTPDAHVPGNPMPGPSQLVRHHLRFGWVAMVVFVSAGIGLEALHAFKSPAYLGVDQGTRRLMWTLAHAHGIGLSLLHMGLAATVGAFEGPGLGVKLDLASRLLTWATVLLPAGFFLGGAVTHDGDPGIGIILVPLGALALWVAVLRTALVLASAPK